MFGLLYTVYPNCTFISVNMYITAYVFIPDRCVSGAFAERGGNNSQAHRSSFVVHNETEQ